MQDMMKQKPVLVIGGIVIVVLILVLVFVRKPMSTTDGTVVPTSSPSITVEPTGAVATDDAMMEDGGFSEVLNTLWQWENTQMNDGTTITAKVPSRYTIKFLPDNTYQVQADCNRGSGTYTVEAGNTLVLGPMAMTLMACVDESQDQAFVQGLNNVNAYLTRDGKLFLTLKYDSGTMQFSPAQ